MSRPGPFILLAFVAIALTTILPVSAQFAPYSFTAAPAIIEAKPGDSVTCTIDIFATTAFHNPVDFTMDIISPGYHKTLSLGTYPGPYPGSFTYVLVIPPDVPAGLTADVVIKAKNGINIQQQTLKLKVIGPPGPIDEIAQVLRDWIDTVGRRVTEIIRGS